MSSNLSLSKFSEINQKHMAIFDTWSSQNRIGKIIGERNKVVDFIFLESEGLNNVLNFHTEQIYQEYFVIKSHHNLVLPDSNLLNF